MNVTQTTTRGVQVAESIQTPFLSAEEIEAILEIADNPASDVSPLTRLLAASSIVSPALASQLSPGAKPKNTKAPKEYSYRTFYIKKKNGSRRKICAPSKDLLTLQRKALPDLVHKFLELENKTFNSEIFHGFIPGRNTVTCAELHKGFAHTITLDISNCFDSISFDMLNDKSLNKHFFDADGNLAQGFATSPILSAIYICKPLAELQTLVKYIDPDAVVTCYADDIQISLSEQTYDTMNRLIAYATHIFAKHKLTINKKKTRIRHTKFGNRKILGIQVGQTLSPNRRLKKKIRAARHQKNGPSLGGLVTASRMLLPKVRR